MAQSGCSIIIGQGSVIGVNMIEASQSKPILAKDNFLLAHKGIVPGVSHLV